jgi:ABC-type maltose transport system permease subunit
VVIGGFRTSAQINRSPVGLPHPWVFSNYAILAFAALSMVPALAFFVLAERRIVGGLTGALKG